MVVDITIVELCEGVLCLATLHELQAFAERLGSTLGIVSVVVVGVVTVELRSMLVERAGSPEQHLAEIAEGRDLVDTQLVLAEGLLTHGSVVPVYRQQVSSLAEILCAAVGTLLEAQARIVELLVGIDRMLDVRHATEILHDLLIPPGTEEIELSCDEVTLLLCGGGHLVEILETDVRLADTIPGMGPERVVKLISRCRVTAGAIEPVLIIGRPVTVVAEVYLMLEVSITQARVHDLVVTPVEGRGPIAFLLIGNAIVYLLYIALEVREVGERRLLRHRGVGFLVEVVGAGSHASGQSEREG